MKNELSMERFNSLTEKFQSLGAMAVVGDIGIDKYTYGEVNKISPEAPVPVLEVKKEWKKLGLAANISHNLNRLGIPSALCGVTGDDAKASELEDLLEDDGMSTWGIVRDDTRATIYKERVTTKSQQICRIDYEDRFSISAEIEKKLFSRVHDYFLEKEDQKKSLIIEDYAKGTLSESLLKKLIFENIANGVFVAVDPGRTTPPLYYKGATLLKPNLVEAKAMCSALGYYGESLEEMVTLLVDKLELEKLVVTLGADGMALLDTKAGGKLIQIPTLASEVFDVSGAGDTSIALLVSGMMAGGTLEEAAWLANCGAGVVVAKQGTATVGLDELREFHSLILKKL